MIWEAVPQCRCSKSERVFTVPCILHIDAGRGPGGNHRGSQLYFHITRYVLKRRREDIFWGAKSESSFCTLFRFKNGLVFVLPIKLMQISMFFADWLVYSGITLVFKFQALGQLLMILNSGSSPCGFNWSFHLSKNQNWSYHDAIEDFTQHYHIIIIPLILHVFSF